jgi:hypothetical protein
MSERAFDILTRDLARATSRREVLRLLSIAAGGGLLAALGIGCDSLPDLPPWPAVCTVASTCGSRHYCNDEETCLCIQSTEGELRCGQLPNTCHLPLCESSADCTYLGAGYFCDTPHSGCCSDPPAHLSRCIAPCGAPPCPEAYLCAGRCCAENERCLGGVCTVCPDERVCGSQCCAEGQSCVGGSCVQTETTLAVAADTAERDLLFFVRQPAGTSYYQGVREVEGPLVGYVTVEDDAGAVTAIIYHDDYYPIQWMLDGMTIQLRRRPGDTFDPAQAFHIVMEGDKPRGYTVDIRPSDLSAVVARLEQETGLTFEGARRFLVTTASSYAEILALARQAGDDQPRLIAAAIGFSTAAAALALADALSQEHASLAPAVVIGAPGKQLVGMGASMLGGVIGDALGPQTPQDPSVPTVGVLLCQGASIIPQVCNYAFFLNRGSPFPCLDMCFVTTNCFTSICQPMTLAWDDVNSYRKGF